MPVSGKGSYYRIFIIIRCPHSKLSHKNIKILSIKKTLPPSSWNNFGVEKSIEVILYLAANNKKTVFFW